MNNSAAVYQFFHGSYENVHAARWIDPPAHSGSGSGSGQSQSQGQSSADDKKKEANKSKTVTVELKCLMCCDACEKRVKNALSDHSAFKSCIVDRQLRKVIVSGESLKPDDVLKVVRTASKKTTEFWPRPPPPEKKQGDDKKKGDKK